MDLLVSLVILAAVIGFLFFVADQMYRDIERALEERWPSRARAWEEIGRRSSDR